MIIRTPNAVAAIAIAACLFLADRAFAAPQLDLPDMPFDQAITKDADFAAFATPSTPVEPDVPTTGAGPTDGPVEDSPEPATLTLLGLGGLGAWWQMRRRQAAQ